ncbi:hypothetical protein MFLAVUS_004044 [Mucor flavus]|uniref:Uncharacterized protein n=1 Tax=Mucor flavus TaxID=439312 RepID=A0ABP9YUT8_9FUNG
MNIRYFLRQGKINLEEIIEDSKNQGASSKRRTIIHAEEEGLFSIKQIEKDIEDDNRSEGESNDPTQYTMEDAAFIETLSKPGKRKKKWREIFDKGKANDL